MDPQVEVGKKIIEGQRAQRGIRGMLGTAGYEMDYQRRLQAAAEAAAEKAQKDAEDYANGVGFKKVPKDDGGYDFLDSQGKPITVQEFSRAKGQPISTSLGGSTNSQDLSFMADYALVKKMHTAVSSGDQRAIKKFITDNPYVQGRVPQDLVDTLKSTYPSIFEKPKAKLYAPSTWVPAAKQGLSDYYMEMLNRAGVPTQTDIYSQFREE